MFRKLFPWAMAALIITFMIAGCSKKPSDPSTEVPSNYAPTAISTSPDTVQVTVKWVRNADAEAQSGFGGYYVYCTSRSLTYYGGNTDSIMGLAQLPDDSLQYFQVKDSPFTGVDQVVVTHCYDPMTGNMIKLKRGTKYYFYVRTMVDGVLSWSSIWSWSSPLAQGNARLFAFVPFDNATTADSGLYGGLELTRSTSLNTIVPTLRPTPITTWRDTLIDSTVAPVTVTITPATQDSVVCGYIYVDGLLRGPAGDTVALRTVVIIDPVTDKPARKIRNHKILAMSTRVAAMDLVAKKISATQVVLQSPTVNDAIPMSNLWNSDGKDVLMQPLPGGWDTSMPQDFLSTSQSITLNVGETGNVYQLYISGCYVKIMVDEVAAYRNTIKVSFHYSYQMAAGIKSF